MIIDIPHPGFSGPIKFLFLLPQVQANVTLLTLRSFNDFHAYCLLCLFFIFDTYVLYHTKIYRLPIRTMNVTTIIRFLHNFRIYLLTPAGRNPMDARLGAIGGAKTARVVNFYRKTLNLISPGLLRTALGPHPEVDLENDPGSSICSTSFPLSE
jgi:hypothetical protein